MIKCKSGGKVNSRFMHRKAKHARVKDYQCFPLDELIEKNNNIGNWQSNRIVDLLGWEDSAKPVPKKMTRTEKLNYDKEYKPKGLVKKQD